MPPGAEARLGGTGLLASGDWAARGQTLGGPRGAGRRASKPETRRSSAARPAWVLVKGDRRVGWEASKAPRRRPAAQQAGQGSTSRDIDWTCAAVSGRSCPPLRATERSSSRLSPSWLCAATPPPPRRNTTNSSATAGALRQRNLFICDYIIISASLPHPPRGCQRISRAPPAPLRGLSLPLCSQLTNRSSCGHCSLSSPPGRHGKVAI